MVAVATPLGPVSKVLPPTAPFVRFILALSVNTVVSGCLTSCAAAGVETLGVDVDRHMCVILCSFAHCADGGGGYGHSYLCRLAYGS